ncbi:MAG TPA: DUF222 domain-containing protein, partial [Mycobacteriales bacterium]|nr:DUF222 domain-containing protein [Mycobacteriales bacterium]
MRDERTHGQRLADALVDLADRALRVGELPDNGGERPTLVVTMPYEKLAAATGVGLLPTGGVLPASQVRRVACDAHIIPAVLGGGSLPLDLGRGSRHHAGAPRRHPPRPRVCSPPVTGRTSGARPTTASTGPTAEEPTRTT